ncbi:hypothetical protein [Prochlorococcus sp. MIT 1307]|uniref:hypothetical protein n=1 Tax=Prochlorococcus sp. MIT 1307 TaxID=3096219 RepID=UPI002A751009|nr:hypothetical protein [Prochlorococcus sp. MIT 1307]
MTKPTLPSATSSQRSRKVNVKRRSGASQPLRRRSSRSVENSDVLISAVISTYLLSHLHHVLQNAEYGAVKEGKVSQAANFAQLRKVLCMDARSMKDASAKGIRESGLDQFDDARLGSKVA